jgi:hypothetical protein
VSASHLETGLQENEMSTDRENGRGNKRARKKGVTAFGSFLFFFSLGIDWHGI